MVSRVACARATCNALWFDDLAERTSGEYTHWVRRLRFIAMPPPCGREGDPGVSTRNSYMLDELGADAVALQVVGDDA